MTGMTIQTGALMTMSAEGSTVETYDNAQIAVDANGIVVAIGEGKNSLSGFDDYEAVDASDCLVVPGFINAHDHLSDTIERGAFPEHDFGVNWRDDGTYGAFQVARGKTDSYWASLLAYAELIRSGVTTTTDSVTAWAQRFRNNGALEAAHVSRLRVVHSVAFVNRSNMVDPAHQYSVSAAGDYYGSLREEFAHDRVTVIPEALSLPRVTDEMLLMVRELASDGLMAMHLTYSKQFQEWALRELGEPALEYLARLEMFERPFLGFHPVWLSEREIELAGSHAGSLGLAYCPVDNMLIAAGTAPIRSLREAGATIGLGIDYPNHSHNMFEVMKVGLLLQKLAAGSVEELLPIDALSMATRDGAKALQMEDQVGRLAVGMNADMAFLNLGSTELAPRGDFSQLLVYATSPRSVSHVMIGGDWVMRDGRITAFDETEVVVRVSEERAKLFG